MDGEAADLFSRLDSLLEQIPHDYFKDPKEFRCLVYQMLQWCIIKLISLLNNRSLIKVLEVLDDRASSTLNSGDIDTSELLQKLLLVNNVIEDIVTFQHGGLNNSLDTMSDVVKEYTRGQEEIRALRVALGETQKVLTAKKIGQVSLRELWIKRVEVQESLRIVKMLEQLKVNYCLS
jgi:hypothetical protein